MEQAVPRQDEPYLLRAVEVAKILRVSRAQVYVLISSGVLPAIRIGNIIRVKRDTLYAWMSEQEAA